MHWKWNNGRFKGRQYELHLYATYVIPGIAYYTQILQ